MSKTRETAQQIITAIDNSLSTPLVAVISIVVILVLVLIDKGGLTSIT